MSTQTLATSRFKFQPNRRFLNGRTNNQRASGAEHTLTLYKHAVLGEAGPIDPEVIRDLLADMLHFCDREQIDFGEQLVSAEANWLTER